VVLLLAGASADAKNIGADPPKCPTCACSCGINSVCQRSDTTTCISRTEGNMMEAIAISSTRSGFGPTLDLGLIYNTYNADGSRATVDTVLGYGWTHSFNVFLFSQVGSMFRFDGDGRVTRYANGPGGSFTAAPGYFETLVKNPDGTFTLTKKDKTVYTFQSIPNTPFLVASPVLMLTSIVDRNGNTTTLSYSGGKLSTVTDTYGRTLTFTYNAQNHLASVQDPAGRVTQFQYDATGHLLSRIIDPLGNTIQYTYNSLYQATTKVDKAGRTFRYQYSNLLPVAVYDNSNTGPATLSNPGSWATNSSQLALFQLRVYTPATTTNTDGLGRLWQYQYDSNGYVTQGINPDGSVTHASYSPSTLQPSSTTDADGNVTSFVYDTQGNRTQMTDAPGHVTGYTYEPLFNMMTSMTDPRGRVTTYGYDLNGNRISETDPLGQTQSWTYDAHGNVLSATDRNGHTTTSQYDASGNLIKITDPLGNITTMTYDAVGNLLTRTDANSHTTSYQYDTLNRVTVITDATGHTDQIVYDGEGNRIQSTDRNGHTTTYQYDVRQRLIKTIDALGQTETYTYDGNNNRLTFTDRNGHTTTYGYDPQNRLNKIADALGNIRTTVYDGVGNATSQTDANGHTTTNTYDALNRRVTATDAAGETTAFQYDTGTFAGCVPNCGITPGSDQATGRTDANGKVTYYKFDTLDRLIRVVRKVGSTSDTITPSDAVTSYTYDPAGNRLSLTEPDGNTTTWQYDFDNRLTKQTNTAGDVTTTAYDGVSNTISTTEPNLNVTTNTYDALNRLTQTTDSIGLVATFSYDPMGNRLSQGDGNGNTTSYSYDALNRLTVTTDALGKTTTTQYDAAGNVIKVIDRNGNATTYTYDNINRRIAVADALGNTTASQYDPVGNLTRLTDANSHATQYLYDTVNRPMRETYADGLFRTYTYDGVGNILTRTDQLGHTTNYTYSDLYFLIARTYPSAVNDNFTYDLSGRALSAQRGTWPVSFTYDGANRITQTVQNGHTISYSYNIPGRTRTVTYPGGRVVTETTDARSRIDHIDDGGSPPPIVQYNYDLGDRVTGRSFRNGTSTTFTYNADNWALNVQHAHGITPIAGFSYAYDNEGNKQFENKLQDTTHSEAYQYDATYRLISYKVGTLVGSTVPVPITQTSYSLDPVGNWNSKTTDAVTQTRTHNAVNELTQIDATALTYDANGNLLNDGSYSYSYDEENRLTAAVRVSDAATVGQYQYDALGRRVQKIANPSGSPTTTRYFYDNARVIEEQDAVSTTLATYVYGNYIDEALTMNRGGQTYYYHQNALWSVEAVTDGTGAAVERYSYDAYGLVKVTDGSFLPVAPNGWGTPHSAIGNPWAFTGRQLDEESGLYFYRARYFDAAKGRFLQRDPLGYFPGMNLYEYAKSNPVRFTDPKGTLPEVKDVPQLLDDLDSNIFIVRDRASRALEYLGILDPDVKKALKKALDNKPSLEVQHRLEKLLEAIRIFEEAEKDVDKLRTNLGDVCDCLGSDKESTRAVPKAKIDRILKLIPKDNLAEAIPYMNAVYCALNACLNKPNANKEARKLLRPVTNMIDDLKKQIALALNGLDANVIAAAQEDLEKKIQDCKKK
jgi:RHS repeat-associated protein